VREYVSSKASSTAIPLGQAVTFSGRIAPAHPGTTVYLQMRDRTAAWKNVANGPSATDGSFSVKYRPLTVGRHSFRMYWAGDVDHAAGSGPLMQVTVG
jgi:hypothetical protein